ncbi:toprim domain-containing protein [Priestia filamentosa]|uniref:toprim domain-containing protein n=1 Tax=Priestia filamentosa TaxID=1402861 RepID=UPI003982C460
MKAKEADLLSYLESKGETFKKEGKYYRHTEHDSLIIRDNMYAWNSRNEKGYGAINFAKMYYNLSFVEAVQDINDRNLKTFTRSHSNEQESTKPFQYPQHLEVKNQDKLKHYLIQERKIDPRLVQWLLQKDLIAQDKRNNIVFKWREQGGKGNIIGADRQGTIKMDHGRGSFKQVLPNAKKDAGFTVDVGKPTKLYMFESPVDLLSYWSLQKEKLQGARLVSMNGLKSRTVLQSFIEARKEGSDIKKVVLSVDNDESGKKFIQKMHLLLKEDMIQPNLPSRGKDWNDVLKKTGQRREQQPLRQAKRKRKPVYEQEMA